MKVVNVFVLFWIFLSKAADSAILEKTASVCNGPCSNLLMQCPADHKIAIREALYGVHAISSVCPHAFDCDNRRLTELCCDMAPGRDCLFPYPLDHLESFHRNCSGQLQCSINTEQTPEASPACSPVEHRNISSYSFFDYVCVNDTFTADLCSPVRVSLHGRTLFALFDARRQQPPPPDSVCACAATPTSWTGKGRVSAFVVDMRLNKPRSTWCSDSELIMEAHPKVHEITCLASHDPYFPYPFVSILNSTNGAISRLVINESPPEFVWIGFEASKDEEIQLTCGLQPKPTTPPPPIVPFTPKREVVVTPKAADVQVPAAEPAPKTATPQPMVLACGIIGGILVIVVVVLIVVWIQRRRIMTERKDSPYFSEDPLYADVDGDNTNSSSGRHSQSVAIEPLYQTVGVGSATVDVYSSPWDSRSNRKFKDNIGFVKDEDDSDDASDLYVTSEQVRRNKKNRNKTAEDSPTDEYVSASEIRKKKKEKRVTFNKNLEEYDRLNYNRKSLVSTPSGYSHLGICITECEEEINTALKEPPKVTNKEEEKKTEEEKKIEEVSNVETEEKVGTLNIPDTDDDGDSTQARASDDDSGLSTDDEKEEMNSTSDDKKEDTLAVPPSATDSRPPSPSPYALAKSFSNEY